MNLKSMLCTTALVAATATAANAQSGDWSLAEAAAPYAGTTVDVVFLLRPGYEAIQEMLPAFTEETGINVNIITHPYENALGEQVRDFVAGGDLDIALIDLVWIGNFAENEWIVPIEDIMERHPELVDPALDLDDFFPLVLNAFGGWNDTVYGLPFDNYSGLMFYNRCMLEEAGFDRPPETWQELMDVYGPALTGDGQYAFALQSQAQRNPVGRQFRPDAVAIWRLVPERGIPVQPAERRKPGRPDLPSGTDAVHARWHRGLGPCRNRQRLCAG